METMRISKTGILRGICTWHCCQKHAIVDPSCKLLRIRWEASADFRAGHLLHAANCHCEQYCMMHKKAVDMMNCIPVPARVER